MINNCVRKGLWLVQCFSHDICHLKHFTYRGGSIHSLQKRIGLCYNASEWEHFGFTKCYVTQLILLSKGVFTLALVRTAQSTCRTEVVPFMLCESSCTRLGRHKQSNTDHTRDVVSVRPGLCSGAPWVECECSGPQADLVLTLVLFFLAKGKAYYFIENVQLDGAFGTYVWGGKCELRLYLPLSRCFLTLHCKMYSHKIFLAHGRLAASVCAAKAAQAPKISIYHVSASSLSA